MKSYIGTKVIQAEPMTKENFTVSQGKQTPEGHTPGYKVIYPDGYESWSPKVVFGSAYREITDAEKMLFSKRSP